MASRRSPWSAIRTAADRRPAASYFALAIAVSWAIWIPAFSSVPETPLEQLLAVPGAFGPLAAAAIVTRLRGESVRRWLRSTLDWRRSPRWYLAALGLPVAVSAGLGALFVLDTGAFDRAALRRSVLTYPITLLVATLLGGGQEEFGWRGFALPHLQERFGALAASVAIGLVWATWHAPLFAFDVAGYAILSPAFYAVTVVAFAVIFGWYYNGSRGCLPGAMLLHGSMNAAVNVPPRVAGGYEAISIPFTAALAAAFGLVAVLLVVRYGPATLAARSAVRPTWVDGQGAGAGSGAEAGSDPESVPSDAAGAPSEVTDA